MDFAGDLEGSREAGGEDLLNFNFALGVETVNRLLETQVRLGLAQDVGEAVGDGGEVPLQRQRHGVQNRLLFGRNKVGKLLSPTIVLKLVDLRARYTH